MHNLLIEETTPSIYIVFSQGIIDPIGFTIGTIIPWFM